jgi:hyperosmotically inducible periplasmic protein
MNMKTRFIVTCLAVSTLLGSVVAIAAEDSDADRSHATAYVKDSAITMKIKTKLAAEHPTSLALIHVDTDKDGAVVLSGSAKSAEAVNRAMAIARETEGVVSVTSTVVVKKDD